MEKGRSAEEREKNFLYWNEFSVRHWYPPLREHTFETCFVEMSVEDARDFVAYQEKLDFGDDSKPLPAYGSPRLERLERELEAAIAPFTAGARRGAFVKLSDRSPKDATTERARIHRFLSEPYARYQCATRDVHSSAVGLPATYEAMMHALRVTSGREALELLLTSFRTLEDLNLRLQYSNKVWEMHVAVREWIDFPIAYELRGFVSNGQFTCLSQYYYDCFFPAMVRHKDRIERSVRRYWETLAAKVPYPSYVIDFAVMTQLDENDTSTSDLPVRVIELNPFDDFTDSALFKWTLHQRVLREGPWEFRIVTQEEHSDPRKKTWWKKILNEHRARIGQAEQPLQPQPQQRAAP